MSWGAALAGLGQGFPQGIKDAQGIEGQYEAGKEQAYNTAAGTGMQLLQALMMHPPQPPQTGPGGMPQAGTSPMPQGGPPMGGQTQQGSGMVMGMGPTVGSPTSFGSRFPVADPSGNPIDTDPYAQGPGGPPPNPASGSSDPTRAGGYGTMAAIMPQGQPPQGQTPQGGPGMGAMAQVQPQQQGFGQQQGGQQGGPLTWQTIIQAVQRANPGAPPDVLFGAVNKMLPLMNAQSLMEWRQIQAQNAGQRVGQGWARVDQGDRRLDQHGEFVEAVKERTRALYGPGHQDYFKDRAAATAEGRTGAMTQPVEGGGGATRQSAMTTERTFASGPEARAVRSFNVVTQHLGVLNEVAEALKSGQVQKLNQYRQVFAQQFGSEIPTNFEAVKAIVTNEMNKAIIGGAGAVFDRAEIQSTMNKAQSPEQIQGVIKNYIKLAAGQLSGLQKQYESGTGKKDFDQRFISPTTKQLMGGNLGGSGNTGASQGQSGSGPVDMGGGWTYHGSQ